MIGRHTAIAAIAFAVLAVVGAPPYAVAGQSTQFSLPNGLQVVVLPDNRSQAVTHLVGYRVGSADDPIGKSGLAHLTEHLMFKSTTTRTAGEFSTFVASMGGQENAVTARDSTIYYQRVTKEQLRTVMAFEADRMANLVIKPEEASAEREVLLAERRSRIGGSPLSMLTEKVDAALYAPHPYATPPVGLAEEIARLTGDDVQQFYDRHYAPDNAFVIIAGDIAVDEVRLLAVATYGTIAPKYRPQRAVQPMNLATRRAASLEIADARTSSRLVYRAFQVPPAATARAGVAEGLDLLMVILAHGDTSRLSRRIVSSRRLATSVDGGYQGLNRDIGQAAILIRGPSGVPVREVGSAIEDALDEIGSGGVAEAEIDYARNLLKAKRSFDWDSQLKRTRAYAEALSARIDAADFEAWPQRLDRVTVSDIKNAAALLRSSDQVTGVLAPADAVGPDATARQTNTSCAGGARC